MGDAWRRTDLRKQTMSSSSEYDFSLVHGSKASAAHHCLQYLGAGGHSPINAMGILEEVVARTHAQVQINSPFDTRAEHRHHTDSSFRGGSGSSVKNAIEIRAGAYSYTCPARSSSRVRVFCLDWATGS
ncbi:uncharacterized protein PITG_01421 [Phytophthora infestans T30-4]|uniref:Uncharacterized protein n=1 Tax=Phytophthora infestans (strain T30-4) TaxID=403677 RepID=D0MT74_PHYIT|nr:uncharacterized protein PITG_01421 [Phytophthora infestans T30-4]EEY61171.1 hypothetical protein PITG_01421 [Phytophthora infestans T30-4]|eukprot:XP_002908088.1 hypothetical protein PITG_01421 [Phytophthora infestans T30-4]